MTRKDYIALAQVIAAAKDLPFPREFIARELCHVLRQDNERFDRDRFLAAAEVNP